MNLPKSARSLVVGCACSVSFLTVSAEPGPPPGKDATITGKCLLNNTFTKCVEQKRLRICVIGNSVTYGAAFDGKRIDSYYVRLADWFKKRFPEAEIEVRTGIIFAIGPEVQLFRMDDKLLAFDPDLVVAEFGAANGAWGAKGRCVTDPATEGYVRRLRLLRPETDLLLNLGLFTTMMDDYRAGEVPGTVDFIRRLAAHYRFPATDSGGAIAKRILAGEAWETFMKDGIHPSAGGYDVHGKVIEEELDRQWALYQASPATDRKIAGHPFPLSTIIPEPWMWPRLESAWFTRKLNGFKLAEHGRVKFIEGGSGASGIFTPGRGMIVGILYQVGDSTKSEPRAELEIRLDGKGEWIRMPLRNEPRFPEDDDRSNYFQRQFFGGYDLPPSGCSSLEFRVADSTAGVT
ncbi:MAG: SGNH/GDSL hydrolase family protein, partial [Victivallales bacterium]